MVKSFRNVLDQHYSHLQEKLSFQFDSQFRDRVTGEYSNPLLGSIRIKFNRDKLEFCGDFESELGLEIDNIGQECLVFANPPWTGLKLAVQGSGQRLALDLGQQRYFFERKIS